MAANRERRSGAGKRAYDSSAFDRIAAIRAGTTTRAQQIQLDRNDDVYDEVTEEDWQAYLKLRREQEGNFVENDLDDAMLYGEDEEWDGTDEGRKQQSISRVNMQKRMGGRASTMIQGDDRISSVLLGAGRQIRPGMSTGVGGVKLTEDDEDTLKAFTQELGDGDDDEDASETRERKRRRLEEMALFGQESALQHGLDQLLESQMDDGTGGEFERTMLPSGLDASALKRALFEGSTAVKNKAAAASAGKASLLQQQGQFNKPLPRLTLDDDGNLVDGGGEGGNMELDDDLIGEYSGGNHSFGINENMPSVNDPTFSRTGGGAAGGSASKRGPMSKKSLPPMAKEITFADSEAGADWFKVSASGVPQMKMERGNVIAAQPNEKMNGISPVYQVKVARTAPPNEESKSIDEPQLTSETYDELTMFWYDACEQGGDIYLFGKALLPDKKCTTSCCIRICNMERNLFVLPRAFKLSNPDDEKSTTDEPVQLLDIHTEIKSLLNANGITRFKSKMVKREYCFDRTIPDHDDYARSGIKSSLLDTDDGVPRDTTYLKVKYGFDQPSLERNMSGASFSRVFGTKSTALELFLLKRNMMGPCWITIKHLEPSTKTQQSWCKFNFQTSTQKNVAVLDECPDAPLFSVMSLAMRTVLNETTQRHEIVMVSYMYHEGVSVEGPTANQNEVTAGTIVSKLPVNQIPKPGTPGADMTIVPMALDFQVKVNQLNHDWQQKANAKSSSSQGDKIVTPAKKIDVAPNERALLSLLLAKLQSLDPDVIVGHDLHGFTIDVLLNRMAKNTIGPNWSKIGRVHKTKMLQSTGKGDESFSLVDRGVGVGRLMVDTQVCSKEFLLGQKNYTLSYLAETQLKVQRDDVESSLIPHLYKKTDTLLGLVTHTENDAYLQLRLMFTVVMLPLSKQLTCLCGNMWSRSLRAARAERVEFLLLHDFHRNKFLIPEKYTNKERKEAEAAREEEEKRRNGGEKKMMKLSKNKPQYAGGLVLEPKRGFYDKYVLLLDFNSLYPSIIQEFNICFTTVRHWQVTKVGEMASPPPAGSESGHLPKVIKRLVQRRRNVKDMLKTEKNPSKRTELDIRQKALKLVANSMYGCLGFVSSRFYCEPLAALITSQGREILQSSVELTNTLNADVIYGDTDSIMVYSNETDLGRAMELGRRIRTEINKRHKILEIDIDGVFKNMLLLRKKKYAALKIIEAPNGGMMSQREVKGLDLVRRDWCPLSKEIGLAVLNEILSGAPREEVVEKIHGHLMKLRDDIKNNVISLDKFIITKGLTKNPKDYTDAKNMPHVKVALDLIAKGKSCKSGDFIPYVICHNDSDHVTLASRAYDPQHVQNLQGGLELDIKWYLSNQILPPVARLIGPIEETDAGRVAYALGLDPKAFHNFGSKDEKVVDEEDENLGLNTSQDDEEKYKTAAPLMVVCPHCKESYQFPGVFHKFDSNTDKTNVKSDVGVSMKEEKIDGDGDATMGIASSTGVAKKELGLGSGSLATVVSGLKCPNSLLTGCPGLLASSDDSVRILTHFTNRINVEIRKQTQAYYNSYYKCNDSGCNRRTRDVCVKGNACLATTIENFKEYPCKGRMEREVPASHLYLQLQYYRSLFDVERSIELIGIENARRKVDIKAQLPQLQPIVPSAHAQIYKMLHAHMIGVLRQSAYYWLPPTIFNTKIAAKK